MAGGGERLDKLAAILAAERERWPLWLPVAFGLGVAGFFALTVDPPSYVAWPLAALAGVCGWFARSRPAALACAVGVCALALGFAAAERRTMELDAPMLTRPLGP
ncbi:MAG TPA: ComEC family competence protein, partial [Azospirillaceae bacterium]|nr:ComEC family competence protein [Azospirillaceae bacterium]